MNPIDREEAFPKVALTEATTAESAPSRGENRYATVATAQAKQSDEEIREAEWLRENHLLRPEGVDAECRNADYSNNRGLVEGLIPRRAVTFLIGDSGLGKSPLAYQLGLCVAAGVPFAGMQTEQGLVIMIDYENGLEEGRNLRNQIAAFLKLSEVPKDFLVWSPDYARDGYLDILSACEQAPRKPSLIIVDSLRSHDPHFEKNEYAGARMSQLNKLAYKYGTAILVIHHTRKPDRERPVASLDDDDTRVMQWLREAAGSGSLINQSHTRIAVDALDGRSNIDAALILRWYRKMRGESGPLYLERVCDESGEPFGYRPQTDVRLLGNADQEAAFRKLPERFEFKDSKQIYGRADDPTRKWLQKCISLGLVKQIRRGEYVLCDLTSANDRGNSK